MNADGQLSRDKRDIDSSTEPGNGRVLETVAKSAAPGLGTYRQLDISIPSTHAPHSGTYPVVRADHGRRGTGSHGTHCSARHMLASWPAI